MKHGKDSLPDIINMIHSYEYEAVYDAYDALSNINGKERWELLCHKLIEYTIADHIGLHQISNLLEIHNYKVGIDRILNMLRKAKESLNISGKQYCEDMVVYYISLPIQRYTKKDEDTLIALTKNSDDIISRQAYKALSSIKHPYIINKLKELLDDHLGILSKPEKLNRIFDNIDILIQIKDRSLLGKLQEILLNIIKNGIYGGFYNYREIIKYVRNMIPYLQQDTLAKCISLIIHEPNTTNNCILPYICMARPEEIKEILYPHFLSIKNDKCLCGRYLIALGMCKDIRITKQLLELLY